MTSQLLDDVAALAKAVLWPAALTVDRGSTIPGGHLDALSDLGLFAMSVPADQGGLGVSAPTARQILRTLGSACGATAFSFAQHGGVAARVARTTNAPLREAWLPALCDRTLGGTAFAHVRRPGPAVVTATRVADGWLLDGEAPWATSWGFAEVFTVAAISADGRLVWGLVPGHPSLSLVASEPMSLVAFGATVTVRLRFESHLVPDDHVLEVADLDRWKIGDRRGAVRPNPLCLGVGDRALSELAVAAPPTAAALSGWWAELTARAEAISMEVDAGSDDIEAIAALRTETIFAVQRLTTALLAAGGGRAADRGHPAQFLARQAMFYVVQAQNGDGRRATLEAAAATG